MFTDYRVTRRSNSNESSDQSASIWPLDIRQTPMENQLEKPLRSMLLLSTVPDFGTVSATIRTWRCHSGRTGQCEIWYPALLI